MIDERNLQDDYEPEYVKAWKTWTEAQRRNSALMLDGGPESPSRKLYDLLMRSRETHPEMWVNGPEYLRKRGQS